MLGVRLDLLVHSPWIGLALPWLVGRAVMLVAGAPHRLLVVDTVALALGIGLALGVSRRLAGALQRVPGSVATASLAFIAMSLVGEPMDGIHRWLRVGALQLHPSAIASPVLLVAIANLGRGGRHLQALVVVALTMVLHVLEPDAGQATACALGVVAIGLGWRRWGPAGLGGALAVGGAALAWTQPDPLAPVRFVEQIVGVAFELGTAAGVLAVVALVALPAAAGWSRHPDALVLAAYFAATIVVPAFGAFPVPVLGHGASPILGAALGLALLRDHGRDGAADPDVAQA